MIVTSMETITTIIHTSLSMLITVQQIIGRFKTQDNLLEMVGITLMLETISNQMALTWVISNLTSCWRMITGVVSMVEIPTGPRLPTVEEDIPYGLA